MTTTLLRQAISALEQLPEDEQDAMAQHILAELEDEARWSRQFAATTDDQWDRMISEVRRDIAEHGTRPLEDFLADDDVDDRDR